MDFFANPVHLILLIVVIVLLFGANKLGDVGGALGKSIREFKKEAGRDDDQSVRHAAQVPPASPTSGYVAPQPPVSGYAAAPTPATPPAYVPPPQPVAPPLANAGYQPAEPQRRMEYTPTEYRPTPPQTPTASSNGSAPEYRGS